MVGSKEKTFRSCKDLVFDQKGRDVCIANLEFPTYCDPENCPMKNTVNLLDDGCIEIRFAQPLKASIHNVFFFGNVRGIEIEVLKCRIVGAVFDGDEALETFYEFNDFLGLVEVKQIVEELRGNK